MWYTHKLVKGKKVSFTCKILFSTLWEHRISCSWYSWILIIRVWCCKNHNRSTCDRASGRKLCLSFHNHCIVQPVWPVLVSINWSNPTRTYSFIRINEQKSEPESGQHTPQEFSVQTAMHLTSQSKPDMKHQVSYTFSTI